MPKIKGIITLQGTMNGMTFYETLDGPMVKSKSSIDKERIATDPRYERTRENGKEFGHCSKMSKLLRNSVSSKVMYAKDYVTSGRLNRIMLQIKNYDSMSIRGERKVWNGLLHPAGCALLKDFDFNQFSPIGHVLRASYEFIPERGVLSFANFDSSSALLFPEEATEVGIQLIATRIDFEKGKYKTVESPNFKLLRNQASSSISLEIPFIPDGEGRLFWLLYVVFYETVNGQNIPLKDKRPHSLNIIDVM